MNSLRGRWGYFLEILGNGIFVLLYTLNRQGKVPAVIASFPIERWLEVGVWLAPLLVLGTLITHLRLSLSLEDFFRKYIFSLVVFIPLLLTLGDREFTYWLSVVHLFSTLISLYEKPTSNRENPRGSLGWIHAMKLSPARLVMASFAVIILGGALLLVLPISANTGHHIGFVDALFMATSATCVTGLSSVSLPDEFSLFGQLVLLTLFQVGGLGMMTLSSSAVIFMGRSLGVRETVLMQDVLDSSNTEELLNLIINIIRYTFVIEFAGAILLTVGFYLEDFEIGQSLYYGFYHAISAFCNAGLSLFNNNLEDFRFSPLIHGTIALLITLGGIGFAVLAEVTMAARERRRFINFSLHTKIVLVTHFLLVAFGATYLFFGEFLHAFADYSLWQKFQLALFQSITTRTAGFNTISLNELHPHSAYMLILLMFIGGSPGSTAGGVKTTTFALLVQSVKSTLSNRKRVEMFERTIPNVIVVRSIAIFIISLITVSTVLLVMMRLETDKDFLAVFFETVSAFGTVGLSLGITSALTTMGKLVLSLLMLIGRVGPLTLVLAVGQRVDEGRDVRYPEGKVLIG